MVVAQITNDININMLPTPPFDSRRTPPLFRTFITYYWKKDSSNNNKVGNIKKQTKNNFIYDVCPSKVVDCLRPTPGTSGANLEPLDFGFVVVVMVVPIAGHMRLPIKLHEHESEIVMR